MEAETLKIKIELSTEDFRDSSTVIITRKGAKRQKDHTDTTSKDAVSILHCLTNRLFHIR